MKFAIILLGLSLNITTILHVGQMSLTVMVFTLLTCFGGGYFIGKALGLNWKLSNLISAGTGICGGSAIAAIAPTIDADDNDVAYAMSATFLFDMAMIVLFPIMGRALGMTDQPWHLGRYGGERHQDCQQVPDGLRTGYHRIEYLLRQHEEGWHPPHDSRFHHFCAGCNCGAAGGDGHGNRVRKLQDN